MRAKANIYRPMGATHVVLAVLSFVLSFVPFSGTGSAPQFKRSQPVQTEWVARQRVVTHRVVYYAWPASVSAEDPSPYSRLGIQHHTRIQALTLTTCARSHAPPVARLLARIIPTSDHEESLFNKSSLA